MVDKDQDQAMGRERLNTWQWMSAWPLALAKTIREPFAQAQPFSPSSEPAQRLSVTSLYLWKDLPGGHQATSSEVLRF